MRKRTIAVVIALGSVMLLAAPASANVGTYCGGWHSMANGVWQNACYIRSANWEIAGRGKAFYDGTQRMDQLNISVTLQSSIDGTHWSPVVGRSCGFTDIPNEAPGAICTTAARYVDAGWLYRTRTFLVLFGSDGSVTTTQPTFSPVTT